MLEVLLHWYRYCEVYTFLLAWIVVPLGFFYIFLFSKNHYGLGVSPPAKEPDKADGAH